MVLLLSYTPGERADEKPLVKGKLEDETNAGENSRQCNTSFTNVQSKIVSQSRDCLVLRSNEMAGEGSITRGTCETSAKGEGGSCTCRGASECWTPEVVGCRRKKEEEGGAGESEAFIDSQAGTCQHSI